MRFVSKVLHLTPQGMIKPASNFTGWVLILGVGANPTVIGSTRSGLPRLTERSTLCWAHGAGRCFPLGRGGKWIHPSSKGAPSRLKEEVARLFSPKGVWRRPTTSSAS